MAGLTQVSAPRTLRGSGQHPCPIVAGNWQQSTHTRKNFGERKHVTAIFRQAQAMAKSNQAYGEQPEKMISGLFPGPLPGTALRPKKRRAQISTHNNPHSAQLPRGSEQIPAEQTLYLTSFVHPGAVPASGEQEE